MSFLNSALELAAQGFYIFPIVPNSKTPLIDNFTERASRDPERIKDWWIDPIMEFEKDYNIGIATSKFGDGEALIVIDVDDKNGKKGSEELEKLDMFNEIPKTFVQQTASGGKHLVYKSPIAVKQGTNVLAKGLDIRSDGGYVVGIGSQIDGKPYHGPIHAPSEAPEWLISACGKANEKEAPTPTIVMDTLPNWERAKDYLENHAPQAVEGSGGDETTYKVAARVKDLGVSDLGCYELLSNHWNDRNSPPWSEEELQTKIQNAYRYGNQTPGAEAPEAQFERVTHEPSEESLSYLQKMNQEYALVYMGGQHFIMHETIDEKGRPARNFLTEQTFKRKFSPYSVQKKTTYAQEWLDWKNRREYKGVCFAPEREARHGFYNLWRGFTVDPLPYESASHEQQKGFNAFISHVRDNICRGDEKLFTWIIGYFAHLVQKPFERPLTTLVFRGGKGTGKNAFIDRIGAILGSGHYLVAHDGRYLTSNFNAHFDSCLCLVLDEAFWSGDKSAEGKLKGITTAPEIMIERKGKEPYMVDNLVRIVIIGNEEWLIPASADERRYAVYDVGDGKKQNRKFFHDMRVAMDDKGGNRILLQFLKDFDLSTVDVNEAPKTQALLEQKTNSLEPFELWWFNCLKDGRILNSEFGNQWPDTIETSSFRNAYVRMARDMNIRSRLLDEVTMGKRIKKMCASISKSKRRDGEGTVHVYKFPTIEEARKDWEDFIGQAGLWD